MKLCVMFPGVGYTVDKPLLYYSGKLLRENGYELKSVGYHDLPDRMRGDREKMERAFSMAMEQVEEQMKDVDWQACEDLVFVGKSIGTALAAAYAKNHGLNVRIIYLTPLRETFKFSVEGGGIAFHGTKDPWAVTADIQEACERLNIPLYLYPEANHSLETGDIPADIRNVEDVIRHIREYLNQHISF